MVLALVFSVARYVAWFILDFPEQTVFYKSIRTDGWLGVPVVVYYSTTAGIVEGDILLRAAVAVSQGAVGKLLPGSAYVIETVFLFGFGHWENGNLEVVATFGYGPFASALYLKLRDLGPLIGAHGLIDLWAFW